MTTEDLAALDEILSLDTGPPDSLTAEERVGIIRICEGAGDEEALGELAACAAQALRVRGDNLRAKLAMAVQQELSGQGEEGGAGFYQLARELSRKGDWAGARELAVRALPLWPDNRVVRLLLTAWEHLPRAPEREEDIALAAATCPDAPDLLWLEAQRADAEGRADAAAHLATEALAGYVAAREAGRAEEPLLRILESAAPPVYRSLLRIIPRIAAADLHDLLDMTLDLADGRFRELEMQQALAATLERIQLKTKGCERLRGPYVRALVESLGGGESVEAFVDDCGLRDEATPLERALERFREMYDLRPGAHVEHAGFGVGRIAAHDEGFLIVDFAERPGHRMALEIARRSLRPLPDGCLRVARFSDPEAIAREIAEDPVALVLRALSDLGGSTTARELRECLAGSTIPADRWSAWWKQAREAAHDDLRIDTSQAFRQVYRLPSAAQDDEIELPPLPAKGGAQGAVMLIERLLRQHPELEDQARERYAQELAQRATAGRRGEGVPAVPLLMRWLPERAEEWTAVAQAAFRREPGVAAGVTVEQQQELLDLGLGGDTWQEAALSALASRFPPVRSKALHALRERLGERFPTALREALIARDGRVSTKAALVNLGLAGVFDAEALSPWELVVSVCTVLAAEPPPKIRDAALELLDPHDKLAGLLRDTPLPEPVLPQIDRVARDLAGSETGIGALAMLLSSVGQQDLAERLRRETTREVTDAIAIHYDPKVTLMTRATYEQNAEKIRDLQRQLATVIPQEIGAARALGDLAENAEYHAARERQGIADATVRSLRSQMEFARVIEDLHFPDDTAAVGTEVVVRDLESGDEQTFWLLGHGDSVQDRHVINYRAPLGQALVGKRPGDVVEFDANDHTQRLEVLAVRKRLP